MTEEEAEIEAVIYERIDAIRSKDAFRAVSTLARDVVAFELPPPLALTSNGARDVEALAAWLAGFEQIDIEIRDMKIEAGNRLGFAHALHHLTGARVDGRRVRLWLRSTLCFRKDDGEWKIAHAHSSVPFYMDGSFRAAIDLEP
jgi:ketosteroid isomerase-like protein